MKKIRLVGKYKQYALVDDADYEWLNQRKWTARLSRKRYYAAVGGLYMHSLILGEQEGQQVDHINLDSLDNRRENLRFCTISQNQANRPKYIRASTSSKYKGVCWKKRRRRWSAQLQHKGKYRFLGEFRDEKEAARAYDMGAIKYHGEFAILNFPKPI